MLGWVRRLWARTRRFHGPVLLVGGVLWDYATLRIDRLFDNVLLGVYLAMLGICIVIQLRIQVGTGVPRIIEARQHWVVNLAHFLLGGLLSAYFIYYLNGAPLLRALVWLLMLGTLAIVLEFVSSWRQLPELWVALYGTVTFHFLLAGGPVLWGDFIGPTFPMLFALLASAGVHVLAAIPWRRPDPRKLNRVLVGSSLAAAAMAAVELVAWKADLIPPLPLTLMSASIAPEGHETFEVGPLATLKANLGIPQRVAWTPGLRVQANTPVFLPARMETTIKHIWERWTDEASGWVRTDTIDLEITGGREAGFRTYSRKRHLAPGAWRVRVTSFDERSLGTIRFELVEAPRPEPTDPPPAPGPAPVPAVTEPAP